jgi:hypothetical protein
MNINIGTADRALRLIVGVVLIALALFSGLAMFDGAVVKYGAVIVGLVMLGTAAMRFCPLYTVLGIRTCKV